MLGKTNREKVLEGHKITVECGRCWQRQPRHLSCALELSVRHLDDPEAPQTHVAPTETSPLEAHYSATNAPQLEIQELFSWPLAHVWHAQQC